ncbi:MATE family efflux transporter [Halalkalibacter sp. AB-rgal2]|uniref:MATE family efflux transporter n=1 Tax=Halalkalibacter sp. AB-rgal2 TaxID=3242695 RepID=UPI00359CE44C
MDQKMQSERLGTESIPTLLKNLSIPAIIGMFVMAFYNVVDTIFISYGVGIDAVAGVTIAFPLMMIIMAVAGALGIGGASVISRRLGERREGEANQVFGTVISVVLIVSVIGAIGAFTFLEPLLLLFGATPDILPYAIDYMFPILIGTIFFSFSFATNNIVRSEGNAQFAMMTMIIPAVLNIILDPIFIFGLNMGVAGAAWATVISQAAVSVVLLHYYLTGKSSLSITWRDLLVRWNILKEVTAVGMPAFVQQASGSIMMIAINTMLVQHGGDLYLGIFGLIQRIIMFTVMPLIGVMQGMMPIVGYNFGARKFERMREAIWLTLKVVTIASVVISALLLLVPTWFLRIFTNDPVVLEEGAYAMRIMFIVFSVVGIQVVSGGLYQALGKAKPAMILSLSRQIIFLIPLVIILPKFFGLTGVWLAFPVSDFLSTILAVYLLYRDRDTILIKGKDEDHDQGEEEPQIAVTSGGV